MMHGSINAPLGVTLCAVSQRRVSKVLYQVVRQLIRQELEI